jgi:hypothetical protein
MVRRWSSFRAAPPACAAEEDDDGQCTETQGSADLRLASIRSGEKSNIVLLALRRGVQGD